MTTTNKFTMAKCKYKNGTIIKYTKKALRLHPNEFCSDDRFIVTGKDCGFWFKIKDFYDKFANKTFVAGTLLDGGEEVRIKFDCYVEIK